MVSDGFARHTPELINSRIMRVVSIDAALISHYSEAITALADSQQWLEVGDTVAEIVSECEQATDGWYSDMLIGSIFPFMTSLPVGWLALDGSTYDEVDYPELYAKLDAAFKNVPASTFTLPDLSGRVILQDDGIMGMGATGGLADVSLTVAEMPEHTHTYIPPVADVDLEAPGAPDILAARLGTATNTGATGSGDAHENRPPFIALSYGVFSGRE